MNSTEPDWLAQLAPAHAPPPALWWPLAPGWWVLIFLTLVIVAALAALAYWQTRPAVRLRRIALRELDRLDALPSDDQRLAQQVEDLVRRYAIARFGRDAVANLSGERWISFVVTHGGEPWGGMAGSNLLRAAYGGSVDADRVAWLNGARAFIRARK